MNGEHALGRAFCLLTMRRSVFDAILNGLA